MVLPIILVEPFHVGFLYGNGVGFAGGVDPASAVLATHARRALEAGVVRDGLPPAGRGRGWGCAGGWAAGVGGAAAFVVGAAGALLVDVEAGWVGVGDGVADGVGVGVDLARVLRV